MLPQEGETRHRTRCHCITACSTACIFFNSIFCIPSSLASARLPSDPDLHPLASACSSSQRSIFMTIKSWRRRAKKIRARKARKALRRRRLRLFNAQLARSIRNPYSQSRIVYPYRFETEINQVREQVHPDLCLVYLHMSVVVVVVVVVSMCLFVGI